MLLRGDGEAVVAVGQASHAWLSGQLARAWGNERFPPPAPREEVCLAAEQHDVGMAQWDRAPTLNAETGLPHSFTQMPRAVRLRLWSEAAGKLLTQSRYAALLVSLHGTTLYDGTSLSGMPRVEGDDVDAFLLAQRALQRRLVGELGADPAQVERNRRLVFAWDWLSLGLCLGWDDVTLPGVPARDGEAELRLERAGPAEHRLAPWPFGAERVTVRCEGRRLAGRHATEAELHAALDAAPHVTLELALAPA